MFEDKTSLTMDVKGNRLIRPDAPDFEDKEQLSIFKR